VRLPGSTHLSKLPTLEPRRYLNLYLILDLYSRYVIANGQLTLHQDRGAPMIAETFRDLLARFGVARSYSRPRVSNYNAASESLFKTVKYSPGHPGRFADLEEARAWMALFIEHYQQRPHEGTPPPTSSTAASMRSTRAARRHSTPTSPRIRSATRTARPRRSARRQPWPSTRKTASR
jgi:transposase InsO family protein